MNGLADSYHNQMEAIKPVQKQIEEAFELFQLDDPENRAYLAWLRLLAQPEPKQHYVIITTGSSAPVRLEFEVVR